MKKYLLPLILILFLTFTLIGDCAWLSGWGKRIELKIEDYAGDIGGEVTWFPVTVKLTPTQCEEVFAEFTTDAEYLKVAFTKADGETELYAECELFDVGEELGIFHVSRDGWTINANTSIFLYYDSTHADNTDHTGKTGSIPAEKVWNDEYILRLGMKNGIVDYDTQYEANVEPDSDGWVLDGTDYASVAGGVLTIDTTGGSAYVCNYYKQPDVDFDAGFYLEIKIQIHTDTPPSGYFQIRVRDGTQNEQIRLDIRDGDVEQSKSDDSETTYVFSTTDTYHIYEIYVKGTVYKLYKDGVLLGTEAVYGTSVSDQVLFGDISNTANLNIECMIDYVYYALGVTDNPLLLLDSTSNHNDGTKLSANEPNVVEGKVGQGQDFDGSDYIRILDNASLDITGNITIETIINADNAQDGSIVQIVGKYVYALNYDHSNADFQGAMQIRDTTPAWQNSDGTLAISNSNWHYFVGYYDGTNLATWLDSAAGTSRNIGVKTILTNNYPFYIGAGEGGSDSPTNFFTGIIDEIRISSTYRSTAWKKGTKNTSWDTLLTYGSEEEVPVVGIIWNGITISKWNGVEITIPINTQ